VQSDRRASWLNKVESTPLDLGWRENGQQKEDWRKARTGTDPKQRESGVRFGIWNVSRLNRASELEELDLVESQMGVRWEQRGNEPADGYTRTYAFAWKWDTEECDRPPRGRCVRWCEYACSNCGGKWRTKGSICEHCVTYSISSLRTTWHRRDNIKMDLKSSKVILIEQLYTADAAAEAQTTNQEFQN
jgi:hypothetical protein